MAQMLVKHMLRNLLPHQQQAKYFEFFKISNKKMSNVIVCQGIPNNPFIKFITKTVCEAER